jgi:hypothetical protein
MFRVEPSQEHVETARNLFEGVNNRITLGKRSFIYDRTEQSNPLRVMVRNAILKGVFYCR